VSKIWNKIAPVAAALLIAVSSALSAQPTHSDVHHSEPPGGNALVSQSPSPVIWMGGSAGPDHDYPRVFTDYRTALVDVGVRVLKLYTADIVHGNEAEIRSIIEYCRGYGLKLAAEGYLVSAFSGSEISEGESPPGTIAELVRRLRSMGGTLDYFESDETLYRAHAVYKHPIREVAANAAHNAQILRDAFPNIRIADIEPFPQDMGELLSFLRAFEREARRPFDIYNPDIAWNSEYGRTTWLEQLRDLSRLADRLHLQLAVIYNGNDRRVTDSLQWVTLAEERLAQVESDRSINVSDAIVQTWVKFPQRVGPPWEPGTMLNLTAVYSSLVGLYRSGYLSGYSGGNARIDAPASLKLSSGNRASFSTIRVGGAQGREAAESRVAVVLIAAGGAFDTSGSNSVPTLARGSGTKVVAGPVTEVNNALARLAISNAPPGTVVDIELFGSKGNIDRKQVVLSGTP
jgi:hypothetical protein